MMSQPTTTTPLAPTGSFDARETRRARSYWSIVFASLWRNGNAMFGLGLVLLLIGAAVFADFITPYDPLDPIFIDRLQGPSDKHWFGTDELGRDLFSRILHGGRLSLRAGFVSVGVAVLGGLALGLISGFYSGMVDLVIMRVVDVAMAMPGILLTMIFIFSFGPSLDNAMLAIGFASVPEYARIVRGSVLSARENMYVDAAKVIGAPDWQVMIRHITPNVIGPVLVLATLGLGGAVLSLAGLSFLGLGAQPPTPEWGVLISDGRSRLATAWWVSTFPGLVIALAVLGINLLGDGLRDAIDPRLRRR